MTYHFNKGGNISDIKDKMKYIFLPNKIFTIGKIIISEGKSNFISEDEIAQMKEITKANTLFVSSHPLIFEFVQNIQDKTLVITQNKNNPLPSIEAMVTKSQLINLMKYSQSLLKHSQENNQQQQKEINKQVEIKILDIKLFSIEIRMNISYINFILFDNILQSSQLKPKIWLLYHQYISKCFESQSDSNIKLLQKHFCYYESLFYFIYIDNLTFNHCLKKDNDIQEQLTLNIGINSITSKMIQPNKIERKQKVNLFNGIITTILNKKDNDVMTPDKTFNDLYLEHFMKICNYGFYTHELFSLLNLNINSNKQTKKYKITYELLNLDINALVLKKIFSLGKDLLNFKINQTQQLDVPSIDIVGNVNIKFITNKRGYKYIQDSNRLIDNEYYLEYFVLSLINLNISVLSSEQNSMTIQCDYNKMNLWMFMGNIIYPILTHIQNQKPITSINYDLSNNKTEIINNIDNVYIYLNSALFSYAFKYCKVFISSFKLLSLLLTQNNNLNQVQNDNISLSFAIKEINCICFGSISTKTSRQNLKKLNEQNESIFKIILHPYLKLSFIDINVSVKSDFNSFTFDIKDILSLIYKQDYTFTNELLTYQNFISDDSHKNFEYILYNTNQCNTLCNGNVNLKEKRINFVIESIVLCLINRFQNEVLVLVEHSRRQSAKLLSFLQVHYSNTNENIDLVEQEKAYNELSNQINKNDAMINKFNFDINIHSLFVDIFSTCEDTSNAGNNSNLLSNTNQKDKMRFISHLQDIKVIFIPNILPPNSILLFELSNINSYLLKDLDIHNKTTTKISFNNSNINDNISIHFTQLGFSNILSLNSFKLDIKSDYSLNTLILKSINIHLCKDTLTYIKVLLSKIKKDISNISNIISILDDDKESLNTETGFLKEKFLRDQLRNKGLEPSGIEFKQIGRAYSEYNSKFPKFKLNSSNGPSSKAISSTNKTPSQNSNPSTKLPNKQQQTQIANTIPHPQGKITRHTLKLAINEINISLYKGEDFNFESTYSVYDNEPVKHLNKRDDNNKITLKLNLLSFTCDYFNNTPSLIFSTFLSLSTILIEDGFAISKYKLLLSHFDFENTDITALAIKCDVIRSPNGNGESEINCIVDLTPLSLHIDQVVSEFLFDFFFVNTNNTDNGNDNDNLSNNNSVNETKVKQSFTARLGGTVDNEISLMNYSLYKSNMFNLNISLNLEYIYVKQFIFGSFFIEITTNAREFKRNNKIGNNNEQSNKMEWMNLMSLKKMKIEFKEFNSILHVKSNVLRVKKLFSELISFYKEDISNNQVIVSILKGIPFIYGLCKVMDGVCDLTCFPYDSYKKDIPIEIGMVEGVRSFIRKTSGELLNVVESAGGFLKRICVGNERREVANGNSNQERELNLIQRLRYYINETEQKEDEYYIK